MTGSSTADPPDATAQPGATPKTILPADADGAARRYRLLVEHSTDVHFELTPDGRVSYVSPRWTSLSGRMRSEAVGRPLADLVDPADAPALREALAAALRSEEEHPGLEARLSRPAGDSVWLSLQCSGAAPQGEQAGYIVVVGRDITAQRVSETERRLLLTAIEQMAELVVITDADHRLKYANAAFEQATGYTRQELAGVVPTTFTESGLSGEAAPVASIERGEVWHGRLLVRRQDGTQFEEEATITPVVDSRGVTECYVKVSRDTSEQKRIEGRALQSQKLEAIGQLAAGIAHEINTPAQFVSDNTTFLRESFAGFLQLLEAYDLLVQRSKAGEPTADIVSEIDSVRRRIAYDMLLVEIPDALEQSAEGLARIADIVRAVKRFSHPGTDEKQLIDLNEAVDTTCIVSRNEWKYVANIALDLEPTLPPVPALPGDLNQVFLNMIVNAAHAVVAVVGEMPSPDRMGRITIATRLAGDEVVVSIADSGCGMTPDVQRRIFDPFFTTKGVGKGTGQGLYLAHDVIVGKHGGRIEVESEPGVGTTFHIVLPLEAEAGD